MKIIIITPYPYDEAPSQRFRFEQYLRFLKDKNVSYSIHPFFDKEAWTKLYSQRGTVKKFFYLCKGYIKRFFILFKIPSCNYVFIHREATPLGPPIFEWVVAKLIKKRIIYDFDDAIWLEDPLEQGTFISKLKNKSKVAYICKWSDKISVGNEFLASYGGSFNKNTMIIPTTIDTENLHNPTLYPQKTNSLPIIGWTGTHSTLHYLDQIMPVIKDIEQTHDLVFMVISNKKPSIDLKSLQFVPWNKETEIQDLSRIDIGLMPLTEDLWSQGKCGFKALQYMALEIPAIASPVGVNNKIIQHEKNGYLCNNLEDWRHSIIQLIENRKKRIEMGKEGRKTVVNNYSVLSNTTGFLSLFEIEQ